MNFVESVINLTWKVFMGMNTPEISPKERRILESLLQEEQKEQKMATPTVRQERKKVIVSIQEDDPLSIFYTEQEYQEAVKRLDKINQDMMETLQDKERQMMEILHPKKQKEQKMATPTVRQERKKVIVSILDHLEYCPSYHALRTQRMFDKLSLLDLENLNSLIQEVSWGCIDMPVPSSEESLTNNASIKLIEHPDDFADLNSEGIDDMDLWNKDEEQKWPDDMLHLLPQNPSPPLADRTLEEQITRSQGE